MRAGTPRWAAFGGNGSVVPMTELEVTGQRWYPEYWLGEALRSLAEGDPGLALMFAKVSVMCLEGQINDQSKD